MADIKFRKFEDFDLKTDDGYEYSTPENNYNHDPEGNPEEFLVGYRTGVDNALFGRREFKVRMDKARGIYYNTTEYWAANPCIPKEGDIYIYTDAKVIGADGLEITTPQMKIGTGNAWLANLRFVNQHIAESLQQHIEDDNRHLNPGEREFWNNKLNVDPDYPVDEEGTLLLNRN